MPLPDPIKWDFYVCQVSEFSPDKFLLCQADEYGEEGGAPIEVLPSGGTRFRPRNSDPKTGAGCPMLVGFDGGKRFSIPLLDIRAAQKLPEQTEGSFIAFGDTGEDVLPSLEIDGESGLIELKRDAVTELIVDKGALTLYTTADQKETGQPVFCSVRDDGFIWESPYWRGRADKTGYHIKANGGARFDLGAVQFAPLSAIGGGDYATLQASAVNLFGKLVTLGPMSAPKDAVALSTPIMQFVTALQAFCAALVPAAASGIGAAGPGGPAAGPAFASAMAAPLATLIAAAVQIPLMMPSKSTSSA